jgi:hypothetical protein
MNLKEKFNYLHKHFKYATMNSWNGLYSIARNVKLHKIGLTTKQDKIAYDMLEMDNIQDEMRWVLDDFKENNPNYEIYFNGRSSGYLVLYKKNNNGNAIEDFNNFDNFEDFKEYYEYDYEYIIERDYNIVQEFNKTVDECINQFKWYCDNFEVVEIEEEITTIQKVKVLKEVSNN